MFRLPAISVLAACAALPLSPPVRVAASDLPLLALNEDSNLPVTEDMDFSRPGELGVEIGALTFVGADLHLFYRPDDSPWMFGWRHLDYSDDFIAGDYQNDDEETLRLTGPFLRRLFSPGRRKSYYLGGALYKATQKIECRGKSDEDSATGLFFGGGLMGARDHWVSYNIGLMFAPGMSLETDTGDCRSDSDGGIDAALSLMFILN